MRADEIAQDPRHAHAMKDPGYAAAFRRLQETELELWEATATVVTEGRN